MGASTPCDTCQVGRYSGTGATSCVACALGTDDTDHNPATGCLAEAFATCTAHHTSWEPTASCQCKCDGGTQGPNGGTHVFSQTLCNRCANCNWISSSSSCQLKSGSLLAPSHEGSACEM